MATDKASPPAPHLHFAYAMVVSLSRIREA